MNEQDQIDYDRIARAILYISEHYREQPALDEVASEIGLSRFHFQRLFSGWAGVSPKQFLQYIRVGHARQLLKEKRATLLDTACELGLSGTARLHDLFVRIEGMTPGEYKNGGKGLSIAYWFYPSHFGRLLVASTGKGVCYMAFADRPEIAFKELEALFPNAGYAERSDIFQQQAVAAMDGREKPAVSLHLKGTPFQLKVWEMLLRIPSGRIATYQDVARQLGIPRASRAVGSAVGDNPVACLIPCHRVIRSTGELGGYHWGLPRKSLLLAWESMREDKNK